MIYAITPHKATFTKYVSDNLPFANGVVWINKVGLMKDLKLRRKDIVLLREWYTIRDIEAVLSRVVEDWINYHGDTNLY